MFTQPGTIKKHDTVPNAIVFESAGYVSISDELYEDSKVTFSFAVPTNKITVIPKYLSDGNYLFVSLDSVNMLHIGGYVKDSEKVYGEVLVTDLVADMNTLTITSNGTQFSVSFNNKVVYRFESALFVNGRVRVHGEAGEVFYSCDIEEPQSVGWVTNGVLGSTEIKVVKIEDVNYMKLIGSVSQTAAISQSMNLGNTPYTLSFSAQGVGRCFVQDASQQTVAELEINNTDLTRTYLTFGLAATSEATLHFESNTTLTVGEIQVENRNNPTAYISNPNTNQAITRTGSNLRYPTKELFDKKTGSLYVKITTKDEMIKEQPIVWTDTHELLLTNLALTIGDDTVNMPITLESNTTYEIMGSWNEEVVSIYVNGETATTPVNGGMSNNVQAIIFADETSIQEELVLEEWALFNKKISFNGDIQTLLPTAVMHSLFDGGISGQNVTWSEIPIAPIDHSPILVQKETGETLQKVSFFNFETGEYETWNQEPFVYDGRSDFVEVAYNNLNEQFRDIAIRTEDGEKIGEPYRIDGKRFYFSLSSNEKWLYKSKHLYVSYQVNDTYTIDYNIKAVDGYRINFAKHDGGKRIVYQEGNRYGEPKKLATMIDMNPIQNQNHEGFLYVTNTINKTDSFRITATPDRLHADGFSFSTLIIEPLDYQGNFLSHSNLEIVAERGFIARHISKDAVEAQKRSGQYLYQYYAPYIQANVDGELVEDYIWITDKDNNIGIGYKMLLRPVAEPGNLQISKSEKDILTAKTTIINYLLMYEGLEKYEDEMLFSILDLDQDDRITMDEILVLETNQKDQELTVILNQLQEWEALTHAATTA